MLFSEGYSKFSINKKQFSEDYPNLLVFDLGHSIANKDDFEAAFEHIVTEYPSNRIVRREGLFYKKVNGEYICRLISAIIAIRDSNLYTLMINPNVNKNQVIDEKFFEILKKTNK